TLGNTLFVSGPPVTIDGGGHGASLSGPVNGPAILVSLGTYPGSGYTLRNLNITPGGGPGVTGSVQGAPLGIDRVNINMTNSENALHAIDLQLDAFAKISLKDVNITMGTPHGGVNQQGIMLMNPTQIPTTPYKAIFDRVTVHGGDMCATIQDGNATVSNSSFQDCVIGLNLSQLYATPVWLVDSTHLLNNTVGLNVGGGTLRLSNNVISGNTTGIVSYSSPTIVSFRNNVFAGNGT